MIITETFENNIFAEGNTFNFEVSVKEIGKSISINTKVIFSYIVLIKLFTKN